MGSATAELFAAEGASVVIADIAEERGAAVAAALHQRQLPVAFIRADATSSADMAAAVDACTATFGGLDIAVSSVFATRTDRITDLEETEWDRVLDVLLKSAYLLAHHSLPKMVAREGGALLFLSSVQASLGAPLSPAYTAAKAALLGLARQLTVDYGPSGIRVNCVSPGVTLNERNRPLWEEQPERLAREESGYPLRRVGHPMDVARALLFLASDEGAFITGVNLPVDGGLAAQNGLAVLRDRLTLPSTV